MAMNGKRGCDMLVADTKKPPVGGFIESRKVFSGTFSRKAKIVLRRFSPLQICLNQQTQAEVLSASIRRMTTFATCERRKIFAHFCEKASFSKTCF
jgi:hypothetical protein